MTVKQNAAGAWDVIDNNGEVVATLATNADAWRWLDRHEVHPLNKRSLAAPAADLSIF
jgi:hypothetical protein